MPKAHHLHVAHSLKPSLEDLAFLIYRGDEAVSKIAQKRWLTRLKEVCEEEGTNDFELMEIMPVSYVLELMKMK